MNKLYSHYSKADMSLWRWLSFTPKEIASKGEGELLVNEEALDKLQRLRDLLGKPLFLTSAYRSKAHNTRVGGAKHSKHLLGEAFDVQMKNHDPHQFEAAARRVGFYGFGYYINSGFMHIDIGPARSWGTPWAKSNNPPADLPDVVATPTPTKPTGLAVIFAAFFAIFGKGRK
jgi:zinc D-Ala-D-Ala carboxypeptidase